MLHTCSVVEFCMTVVFHHLGIGCSQRSAFKSSIHHFLTRSHTLQYWCFSRRHCFLLLCRSAAFDSLCSSYIFMCCFSFETFRQQIFYCVFTEYITFFMRSEQEQCKLYIASMWRKASKKWTAAKLLMSIASSAPEITSNDLRNLDILITEPDMQSLNGFCQKEFWILSVAPQQCVKDCSLALPSEAYLGLLSEQILPPCICMESKHLKFNLNKN